MKREGSIIGLVLLVLAAAGCASVSGVKKSGVPDAVDSLSLPPSYLQRAGDFVDTSSETNTELGTADVSESGAPVEGAKDKYLKPLDWTAKKIGVASGPEASLPADDRLEVAAERMPVPDFIHYVFGQLLGLNYVLDPTIEVAGDGGSDFVTLSVANAVSSREVFNLAAQILAGRDISIKYTSDTFFLSRNSGGVESRQALISFGRDKASVPKTSQKIMQIIPVKFGIKVFMERTLRELGGAKITPDFAQSTIIAEGSREQILKVIELIDILDSPAARGNYIGLVELNYISLESFTQEVMELLENEGIKASLSRSQNTNVVLVPLRMMGAAAVFSTDKFFVERVNYWASILDVPTEGEGKRFYIYNPKYSRAEDLEESVKDVLGISRDAPAAGSGSSTGNAPPTNRQPGAGLSDISVAKDEKSNSLIFYTTGQQYRDLQPLLKHLDVIPQQVMLDILIAEVSLKNEFRFGVEWAVSRGEVNLTTQGAFGATSVGGIGLVVSGKEGPLQANALATNSLVNVLSNPSLMVRAGSSATINVGSSISIVGATTQDPINGDRQESTVEYKKTGVSVSVSVDVNSVGIVAMEIDQNISNTVPGGTGAGGNPDVFERTLSTEVLAESGQTILLGGLISQASNRGGSGVPLFSKIPLFGALFKADGRTSDRTELVMLVTPKVIDDLSSWDTVIQDFSKALRYLDPLAE